jgi:predicted amidohydrolase YtcJ
VQLLFIGGLILTMDPAGTVATALVVQGGEIVWVGDANAADTWRGPQTQVVDLAGAVLMPGLHDTHVHLAMSGVELLEADLASAETVDALLAEVARHAKAHPEVAWVTGGGWDLARFDGQLTAAQLDQIVPDRPVALYAADGHSAWVNSRALQLAGIGPGTPDPPGGRIERDSQGAPTGILREEAVLPVEELLPMPTRQQADDGLELALELAASHGITTALDPSVEAWSLQAYRRAQRRGTLSLRLHGAVAVDPAEGARAVREPRRLRRRYDGGEVHVDGAKLYLDGVLESATAALLEPYVDGSSPQPPFTDAQLDAAVQALDQAGFALHFHAIGDAAVRQGLDALAALPGQALRPTFAHLELIDPADLPRFAPLGALASFQALWAWPDPYVVVLTLPVVGPERGNRLYPIGALVQAGGTYVGGSDWSVSSMNPFEAIEVAVTRRDPAGGVDALAIDQAVTVITALHAYTSAGAMATGTAERSGTLEVGKRADLIVIDRDPRTIPPAELGDIEVQSTWLGGRQVWPAAAAD